MESESDLYTTDDLIKKFQISEQTLYNWIKKEIVPNPIKMGRLLFWEKIEIEKRMGQNRHRKTLRHT